MTRRRAWLLAAMVLAAVVAAAMFHSDIVGWWRGEATYRGRYTNAWRAELRQYNRVLPSPSSNPKHAYPTFLRTPTPWQRWLTKLWPNKYPIVPQFDPPLQQGDAEAIPVLLELLHATEPHVRALAVRGLGKVGPAAHEAIPVLVAALDDASDMVATEAAAALDAIDPQALDRVGLGDGWWLYYRPINLP